MTDTTAQIDAVEAAAASSATTDVILAARNLVEEPAAVQGGYLIEAEDFHALDAALKAYDARRAEMSAMWKDQA
jgi:hypothetical protein